MGWGNDDDLDVARAQRAAQEAENGLRQARYLVELVRAAVDQVAPLQLVASTICELNRLAVEGVMATAGRLRVRSDVEIGGSSHVLPPHEDVPALVDQMCSFVSEHWDRDALFLSAYVLWRLCWIHPFDDGNGRTARASAYLVMAARLGFEPPGERPVFARIKHAPIAYHRALEAADKAWSRGTLDVSQLQSLLAFYLDAQVRDLPPVFPDD